MLADELRSPSGLVSEPLVAGRLCEGILNGFPLTGPSHDQADGGIRRRTSSTAAGPGCHASTQAPSVGGVTMPSSRKA
jgi:hypothetical protein